MTGAVGGTSTVTLKPCGTTAAFFSATACKSALNVASIKVLSWLINKVFSSPAVAGVVLMTIFFLAFASWFSLYS
jgi:hypothetical protein